MTEEKLVRIERTIDALLHHVAGGATIPFSPSRPVGDKQPCWEYLGCKKTDCPVYRNRSECCWFVNWTLCSGEPESFVEKARICFDCRYFLYFNESRAERILEKMNFFFHIDSHLRDEVNLAHNETILSYQETVFKLVSMSEFRDTDTGTHVSRMGMLCQALAANLRTGSDFAAAIRQAAAMHDIGKVGIPDTILLKPGPLDSDERQLMEQHTTIGGKILAGSHSPFLKMGQTIALTHHERFDGSGYPNGIKGNDIPLAGRIANVLDQYDALRSRRPYKKPLGHTDTKKILLEGDGRTLPQHFDPDVLQAFAASSDLIESLYAEYS